MVKLRRDDAGERQRANVEALEMEGRRWIKYGINTFMLLNNERVIRI